MNLVFISHDSNYSGGAQKCLVDLLQGIKSLHPDYRIYVVFRGEGNMVQTCQPYIDGYKVIKMHWWVRPVNKNKKQISIKSGFVKVKYLFRGVYSGLQLIRYLRNIKPDYGITNTIVLPHLAYACKLLKIKHAWFIHEIPALTWTNIRFIFSPQNIHKWIGAHSELIVTTSEFSKQYYRENIRDNNLYAVNQAVELAKTDEYKSVSHRYTICLVGAFEENKGQLELLQAIKTIVISDRDIYCYLVGPDSGDMEKCKQYIANNKLGNNVDIIPFTRQVSAYYYKSDVALVCSKMETFSRVAVEAQQCGLPVILSNVGANPERIHNGINGLLYEKGNINDLIEKIEILRNPDTRNNFSKNINLLELNKYNVNMFACDFISILK